MTRIETYLFKLTSTLPCRLIHRGQRVRYLERYWLGQWWGFTAYLHRFVARDADDWVHDHPWSWSFAIVLTGEYREERLRWFSPRGGWQSRFRCLRAGRFNVIRGKDFHRIIETKPETWTLFVHGPRVKGWGFLEQRHDEIVYHQPYDVSSSAGWQLSALRGDKVDRAPLREIA